MKQYPRKLKWTYKILWYCNLHSGHKSHVTGKSLRKKFTYAFRPLIQFTFTEIVVYTENIRQHFTFHKVAVRRNEPLTSHAKFPFASAEKTLPPKLIFRVEEIRFTIIEIVHLSTENNSIIVTNTLISLTRFSFQR